MSLVELMVSITIGLVILGALVALFVNTSRTNREMAGSNALVENGRLAVQLLESDVMHAGFWDTHVPDYDNQTTDITPADMPTGLPNPCLAYNSTNWDAAYKRNLIGVPVQVYGTTAVCSTIVASKATDTDVLVVRRADTCIPDEGGNCEATVAGRLYFQATQCGGESTTPYRLDTTGFTLHKRNCTTAAVKRQFLSNLYYVRNFAVTTGDGIPTLMRSQFDLVSGVLAQQPAVPMIEGIQGFHVEVGVDDVSETGDPVDYSDPIEWVDEDERDASTNRGDGVPDDDFTSCTTACTYTDLMNVTAVKLYVLVRSRDETLNYTDAKTYHLGSMTMGPYNDHYKRHVFSSTVRLPNIAGRRATP